MKLSIIIPVYNTGALLENCLKNILSFNRLEDLEVLLVDNNSTDNSLEIANSLAKKHPKALRVLQCKTPGAAAARNFAIARAKGDYLWFVDSDDEVAKSALKKLFAKIDETHADIINFGMLKKLFGGNTREYAAVEPEHDPDWQNRFVMYGFSPCQSLYRRSFWNRHLAPFPEGHIHEDMALLSAGILYTKNVTSIPEPLYYYIERENSILHQTSFNPTMFDIFPALENLRSRFESQKLTPFDCRKFNLAPGSTAADLYHDALEYFHIWNLLLDSHADFVAFKQGRPGLRQTRQTLREFYPHWRKNKYLRKKPWKTRLKYRLNYWF